jgi:hypothetical protein
MSRLTGDARGTPGIPSDDLIGRWERGEQTIPASDRATLLALLKVFKRFGALATLEEAAVFLALGGYAEPKGDEIDQCGLRPAAGARPADRRAEPADPPAPRPSRCVLAELQDRLEALLAPERPSVASVANLIFRWLAGLVSLYTGVVLLVLVLTVRALVGLVDWPYRDAQSGLEASMWLALATAVLPAALAATLRPEGISSDELARPAPRRAELVLRFAAAYTGYFVAVATAAIGAVAFWHLQLWPLPWWFWVAFAIWWCVAAAATPCVLPGQILRRREVAATERGDYALVAIFLCAGPLMALGAWLGYPFLLTPLGGGVIAVAAAIALAYYAISAWRARRVPAPAVSKRNHS